MSYLLIVANCPSDNALKLFESVVKGAKDTDYPVVFKTPLEATAADVISSSGVILGTTENFGYMSGLVKDFLERIYYPCMDQTDGLPWAFYVKAGLNGTGATNSVQKVISGLRWKLVQEPVLFHGAFKQDFLEEAETLGAGMAEGLKLGIF
ncbi:flavodoxin [Leucothrix pacifica]|uniref:Flavodoxin n=1 Tax=Leucothrix pacifica TaxID=1247513 RepID=A0A317C1G6_9GAMM|nr:flavodoxin [Leucothrix pacifica]PWQ92486.1 flavodoxin [Leucothrix pacifica]